MSIFNDVAAPKWSKPVQTGSFEAMGAADRKFWSSFVRQTEIDRAVSALNDPATFGVAVVGPWGVGKTTLARAVEAALTPNTHIERLFGSSAETLVSYGSLSMLMARLPATALETPTGVIRGIDELIRADADGRKVLLVVDDLPGLDVMTVGVIMHLLLGESAKLLVMARDLSDLPEDLAWLAKDGQLGEVRLDYFSRAEVGELIGKATGTFVSETAVTALHEASNGIPLVLQALFREQVANGGIKKHLGGWVVKDTINIGQDSALADIVHARLARESAPAREGVEKLSLLGSVPLKVAMSALGPDVLWQLEESGFVEIAVDGQQRVSLTERYVGDVVRNRLSTERMSEIFAEISLTLNRGRKVHDGQDAMYLAAWVLDAGMTMEPSLGVAAAHSALRHFDPLLALRCTANVPSSDPLWVQAIQTRSTAYRLLAEYQAAVTELETVPVNVIASLALEDYGAWVLAFSSALLWVPSGTPRIEMLLVEAEQRLVEESTNATAEAARQARQLINLARFQFLVHEGDFADIQGELETAAADEDSEYAANCACLLVPTLAVIGREIEAINLAERIEADSASSGTTPLFSDYYRNGLACAQIWSGRWLECVDMLRDDLAGTQRPIPYRGGLIELNLGLAHAFAGRGTEAIQVLMSAAAQLEARTSDNALGLAYSALAFCHAQVNNEQDAMACLALARSVQGPTLWTNRAMAEFFNLLALRWLDDPHASEKMRSTAAVDLAKGRMTTASMLLFAASIHARDKDFALLEEISLRRQGPMATVNVLLARSCQTRSADVALEAAAIAQTLKLDAVESRCAVLALDFAREAGRHTVARKASHRLERLNIQLPKLPLSPHTAGVKLTQREIQVAKLAKRGLGNRAIADRIGVSVRTVEGHLYQLYSKLGITTRNELAEEQDF